MKQTNIQTPTFINNKSITITKSQADDFCKLLYLQGRLIIQITKTEHRLYLLTQAVLRDCTDNVIMALHTDYQDQFLIEAEMNKEVKKLVKRCGRTKVDIIIPMMEHRTKGFGYRVPAVRKIISSLPPRVRELMREAEQIQGSLLTEKQK